MFGLLSAVTADSEQIIYLIPSNYVSRVEIAHVGI